MLKIHVLRSRPGLDPFWQEYQLPAEDGEGQTVLSALIDIRRKQDETLAFRYGCRYQRCGLCAVEVNGRPRLACRYKLEDGQKIAPLSGLPVVKDLVVDRRILWTAYRQYGLFVVEHITDRPPEIRVDPIYHQLARCSECLACLAACPRYQSREPGFWGPWLFVRLAMLKLDPRDTIDRMEQASRFRPDGCRGCRGCFCPSGVPAGKALQLFLP